LRDFAKSIDRIFDLYILRADEPTAQKRESRSALSAEKSFFNHSNGDAV
jgi:hypothetical protein